MPLGSLLHAKAGPLRGAEKYASCTVTVKRTSSGGEIELKCSGETIKVFDKKMPRISEIRVATGFGFSAEWRVLTQDGQEDLENRSPMEMAKAPRNSDTPSIVFPKKTDENEENDTPFSGVLLRRPALRTPMSENTRSPFPFSRPQQKSSNALASLRTVLGQFE